MLGENYSTLLLFINRYCSVTDIFFKTSTSIILHSSFHTFLDQVKEKYPSISLKIQCEIAADFEAKQNGEQAHIRT